MTLPSLPAGVLVLVLLVAGSACKSTGDFFEPRDEADQLELAEANVELDTAEQELETGAGRVTLERIQDVLELDGLDPATRYRAELLLERAATQRLAELRARGASADEFDDLYDSKVPKRVRVSAGVEAARRLLEDGEPLEAYSTIRKIDEKFSSHHERAAAGDVLADAGFALAESKRRYLLLFRYRARAPEVLEYLVLNYPSNRRGEEAYMKLASLYEEDGEREIALERYEDLLLYYPESRYRPYAEARIPALRLDLVVGPEYDRAEILRAERELQDWLASHPGNPLEGEVLETLAECQQMDMDSDLSIAAFYHRVNKDFGAKWHADRALKLALQVEDDDRARRADEILEDIGPVEDIAEGGTP